MLRMAEPATEGVEARRVSCSASRKRGGWHHHTSVIPHLLDADAVLMNRNCRNAGKWEVQGRPGTMPGTNTGNERLMAGKVPKRREVRKRARGYGCQGTSTPAIVYCD